MSADEFTIRNILRHIGDDPSRPGLAGTPGRVLKMWKEVFYGYKWENRPRVTVCRNGEDGIHYSDMIIDRGYFFSHCEHHMVPFFGTYSFGYIPDQYIIGASKISRIVDFHSARLQVAERLVHDIVNDLEEALKPKGLILIMTGRHLCKEMRGVKKFNSPFEVIAVRGVFLDPQKSCKEEFLARVGNGR